MQTAGAPRAAVHRQFDSVATMMPRDQSLEDVRGWSSSEMVPTMTRVATDCSATVRMHCRRCHLCRCLLSSDAKMPSSVEEHPHSNLSWTQTELSCHCKHSMWQGLLNGIMYVSLSVIRSVSSSDCCSSLQLGPAGRRYQLTAVAAMAAWHSAANVSTVMLPADEGGWIQPCFLQQL